MKKKCNPTKNNKGGRILFCAHYNDCLDHAVKKAWNSWNCSKCDMKNKYSSPEFQIPAFSEEIAYYEFGDGFSSSDLESLISLSSG